MQQNEMTALDQFCASHRLEVSFVTLLEEHGLVEITVYNEVACISNRQLPALEQMIRLHRELNINFEGIDAIHHLLQQMDAMRSEISGLKNRLRFYQVEENVGEND